MVIEEVDLTKQLTKNFGQVLGLKLSGLNIYKSSGISLKGSAHTSHKLYVKLILLVYVSKSV